MNCDAARDAISALLDGELPASAHLQSPGRSRAQLEAHLAGCAACREWREQAHEVTRRARLAVARPAPAPDPSLLAAMSTVERRGAWWRTLALTRIALVALGLAQIALSLPELLSGVYREAPIHVAHEMGALDVALGTGFLVAAWRPLRAQGMRTLVGCAALLLVLTTAIDLAAGRTGLGDEAPHLLVVAGWLLLWRAATLMPLGEADPRLRLPRPGWSALRPRHPSLVPEPVVPESVVPEPAMPEPVVPKPVVDQPAHRRVAESG
jgi:predicted anti-sigma-YlaC factor YlaD